jgi:hypothetical protein
MLRFKGMFSRFRKLFRRKSDKFSLILDESDQWLDKKTREIYHNSGFNVAVYHFLGKLRDKRTFLDAFLEEWEESLEIDGDELEELAKTKLEKNKSLLVSRDDQLELISNIHLILEKLKVTEEPKLAELKRVTNVSETFWKEKKANLDELKNKIDEIASDVITEQAIREKLNILHCEISETELFLNNFALKMKISKVENVLQLQRIILELREVLERENDLKEKVASLGARSDRIKVQKEEKESELLRLKDSPDYEQSRGLLSLDEKGVQQRLEELEDKIFLYLVRLKKCINDLEDYNSDYSLLYLIQEVNNFQEDIDSLFDYDKYALLIRSLEKVEMSIHNKELIEKESCEFSFLTLLQDFRKGDLKLLREEHNIMQEKLRIIPKERLKNDFLARVEDQEYRLEHFQKQEEELQRELSRNQQSLAKAEQMKSRKKFLFENLVKLSFETEVELVLRGSDVNNNNINNDDNLQNNQVTSNP